MLACLFSLGVLVLGKIYSFLLVLVCGMLLLAKIAFCSWCVFHTCVYILVIRVWSNSLFPLVHLTKEWPWHQPSNSFSCGFISYHPILTLGIFVNPFANFEDPSSQLIPANWDDHTIHLVDLFYRASVHALINGPKLVSIRHNLVTSLAM